MKRLIAILALAPSVAAAAIAVDTTSNQKATSVAPSGTMSWSHTVSGTNRLLVVALSTFSSDTADATYAGIPMTRAGTGSAVSLMWYLVNPPLGVNTVTLTRTGGGTSTNQWNAGAVSWTGVDQTSPVRASTVRSASTQPTATITVSSAVGDTVMNNISCESTRNSPGAGETMLWSVGGPGTNTSAAYTTATGTSTTMTWTLNTSNTGYPSWQIVGLSIRPAAGGGGTAPTVVTSAATAIAASGATLNGSGNPNGGAATGWFRYSTTNPGACSDTFGTRAPASGGTSLGSGTAAVAYAQAIAGLVPGTTYFFCAIASNPTGTGLGSVLSFTTAAAPLPSVTTLAATSVAPSGATLNGSANPNGAATTGWFRYSATNPGTCSDTFGTRIPTTGGTALGSGTAAGSFNRAVTGLASTTTYYYCAIASSSTGTAFGSVLSFTTTASGVPLGSPCSVGSDCASGFCAQGVCCNTACNAGPCQACSVQAGAPSDGTCAIVGSGWVCRGSAGDCDVEETCDGVAATCPPDRLASPGVTCRPDAGLCDAVEVCNGTSATCPADVLLPSGAPCRPAAGACDVPEACDGISLDCPADQLVAAGTSCRPDAGVCDLPAVCTGTVGICPNNPFVEAGSVCRPAVALCDQAEACTGASAFCPVDALVDAGVVCRPDAGACDLAEACTGASSECPADAVVGGAQATAACACAATDATCKPSIVHDAIPYAAVRQPYEYNAQGSITVTGAPGMSYGTCGGPPELSVESGSGAVQWLPAEMGLYGVCVRAENAYGADQYRFDVTVEAVKRGEQLAVGCSCAQVSGQPLAALAVLAVLLERLRAARRRAGRGRRRGGRPAAR